jgi:hypothetical protein
MIRQILLALVLIAAPVAAFTGFQLYAGGTAVASSGLGDMSAFKTIVADVQVLAVKGDLAGAAKRVTDYESAWDAAETAIRPLDQAAWNVVDGASDDALKALRRPTPKADEVNTTLAALMAALDAAGKL